MVITMQKRNIGVLLVLFYLLVDAGEAIPTSPNAELPKEKVLGKKIAEECHLIHTFYQNFIQTVILIFFFI